MSMFITSRLFFGLGRETVIGSSSSRIKAEKVGTQEFSWVFDEKAEDHCPGFAVTKGVTQQREFGG